MRVLFLDIDGVLNRNGTKERCGNYIGVDRALSDRLLGWLKTTDVQIVLSSTWRLKPELFNYALTDHLKEAGIHWIDVTPNLGGYTSRGREINAWLAEHPEVAAYAILDDVPVFLPDQMPRAVITREFEGLTEAKLQELAALF